MRRFRQLAVDPPHPNLFPAGEKLFVIKLLLVQAARRADAL